MYTIIILWVMIYFLNKSQDSLWFGTGTLADVFGIVYLAAIILTTWTFTLDLFVK